MSDMGWSKYISAQENDNYSACFACAAKNNINVTQAENCENMVLGCVGCPWRNDKL